MSAPSQLEAVQKLIDCLSHPELGFRAGMLLSNLGLDLYPFFEEMICVRQQSELRAVLEIIKLLPTKIAWEVEKLERRIAKDIPSPVRNRFYRENSRLLSAHAYTQLTNHLIAAADVCTNLTARDEILHIANTISKSIQSSQRLSALLLNCYFHSLQAEAKSCLQNSGHFGEEALSVVAQAAHA